MWELFKKKKEIVDDHYDLDFVLATLKMKDFISERREGVFILNLNEVRMMAFDACDEKMIRIIDYCDKHDLTENVFNTAMRMLRTEAK